MSERHIAEAIKKHGDSVLRVATSVTGNLSDAEDVFSDVFFSLWQYNKAFLSSKHLKAWLIRVAVNKAKNIRKRAHNRYRAELHDNIALVDVPYDRNFTVTQVLERLKPDDRAVLYLHYYEGYTYGQIARMLGIRESSVRSKAMRARGEMKELLNSQI